jgi:hypothetical protein
MKKIILTFILALQILTSCINKQEDKSSVPKNVNKIIEIDTNKQSLLKTSNENIAVVLDKMRSKKKLTDFDYQIICEFLQNNNDEALAEEVGYTFYEFFKMNMSENSKFKNYINELSNKNEILITLVQIMCLDLGEDNYNSKNLQKDYPIFNGEFEALKSFKQCMSVE